MAVTRTRYTTYYGLLLSPVGYEEPCKERRPTSSLIYSGEKEQEMHQVMESLVIGP